MSLAVAIEASDGIVLGADSRATYGDPRGLTAVNDTVQKIYRLTPRTAIALVGQAETGASLIQYHCWLGRTARCGCGRRCRINSHHRESILRTMVWSSTIHDGTDGSDSRTTPRCLAPVDWLRLKWPTEDHFAREHGTIQLRAELEHHRICGKWGSTPRCVFIESTVSKGDFA